MMLVHDHRRRGRRRGESLPPQVPAGSRHRRGHRRNAMALARRRGCLDRAQPPEADPHRRCATARAAPPPVRRGRRERDVGKLGDARPGEPPAAAARQAGPGPRHRHRRRRAGLHRGPDGPDGLHLSRPDGGPRGGHRLRLPGSPPGGGSPGGPVPHRARRAVEEVPLHELRGPVRADAHRPRPGPVVAQRRVRGRRRRGCEPPVPPLERRPLLRQRQRLAGRDLADLLQQQHAFGTQPAVDAVRGQSRERSRQRPPGLPRLPDPLRPPPQWRATSLRRQLVCLHGRSHPGRLDQQRRRLPAGRRLQRLPP